MRFFCDTCGEQALEQRGKRHMFCHICRRLWLVSAETLAWYAAEAKRYLAGRKMPADYRWLQN
jgi:hypothetical protein